MLREGQTMLSSMGKRRKRVKRRHGGSADIETCCDRRRRKVTLWARLHSTPQRAGARNRTSPIRGLSSSKLRYISHQALPPKLPSTATGCRCHHFDKLQQLPPRAPPEPATIRATPRFRANWRSTWRVPEEAEYKLINGCLAALQIETMHTLGQRKQSSGTTWLEVQETLDAPTPSLPPPR